MKQFKLQSVVCCLMLAAAVTSCLDSDDDNNNQNKGLSKAEIALCYTVVGGEYTGKLMYYNEEQKVDTVDIDWYIPSDSMLIVPQFPAAAVAGRITSGPIREALLGQPAQPLNCYIGFINTSPVEFLVNPPTLTYNLNYSGGDHKVQVLFYVNNSYSFGTYDATAKQLAVQLIAGGLYVDDQLSSSFPQSVPLIFLANPKE